MITIEWIWLVLATLGSLGYFLCAGRGGAHSELREVGRLKETASREPLSLEDMRRIARSLRAIETAKLGRVKQEIEERSLRTRGRRFFERLY